MNKSDIVAYIADKAGLSKSDAIKALDAFVEAVEVTLKRDGEVRLIGFGTFYVSQRAAMEGRNPSTGQKMTIPAVKLPKFKAGKTLKDHLL